MATLTPWLKPLISRIPSVPEDVITDELIRVAIEFFKDSSGWRQLIRDYKTIPGIDYIDVNPIDARIQCVHVVKAFIDGVEISQLPHDISDPRRGSGKPTAFTCERSPSMVTFVPVPDAVYSLDVLVALTPKCPDKWVPDILVSHHYEAILDGTLGRFYSQPFKPYSSPLQAEYHLRRYRALTQEARARATRGYTHAAADWAFPAFGA